MYCIVIGQKSNVMFFFTWTIIC